MKKLSIISCFIGLMLLSTASSAACQWFVSTVVEVSARSDDAGEYLYIRTESNPNPANCGSVWNGAQWSGSGRSYNLAASVALSAKLTGKNVRFCIHDGKCGSPSGNPVMDWIQQQ